ncbi:GTPase HflX [Desulfobulbus oralis]|uniref:GTPase HflX n=1 Tax=Desulfobulbus oralis TaxID=1986146 RepID=A0A2L1GPK7_9BACT|nr:GTPase HflX [Desulfobulbus oralis]AVD71612.1 GTPase HflX [Desulfobulbus oralis]
MTSISGNTTGLKPAQQRALERLAERRIAQGDIIDRETARQLAALSFALNRQLGLLIHRSGQIACLMVGDFGRITFPALAGLGSGKRLRGLRCVRTTLGQTGITDEDVMDLACLRLDLFSVLSLRDGLPDRLFTAHLIPQNRAGRDWAELPPVHPANQSGSCLALIEALEDEFARTTPLAAVDAGKDRAILVSVSTAPRQEAEASLNELAELARSAGVVVLDRVLQRRRQLHPRFLMGQGKLLEIMLASVRLAANLLIFDQELTPSQMRSITDHSDLRVIDRTQLILDIFARRARSREGKLQIEMAQLKYMLPRLGTRDDALSRLTGGIGARGPGETRLEIDKRRINDRIARLARELKNVGQERYRRRGRRRKREVPVISLVGYTNAGKSTLLNTLTHSDILAEDLLFATLDPSSRRLRFPEDMEVIITDTVGFIRNLPAELLKAFASTLEELREADLILHVIDRANPEWRQQAEVVADLLTRLELDSIPSIRVLNKMDLLGEAEKEKALQEGALHGDIGISAMDSASLRPLLGRAEKLLRSQSDRQFFASAQVLK